MTHSYEPRKTVGRHGDTGIDHGASGAILAELRRGKSTDQRLVWFGPSMCAHGARGFGRYYVPTRLSIVDRRGYWVASIFEGGRLSKTRLVEHHDKIDRHFGPGVASLLDPRRTLVLIA